jgi:hypothetical protein
MVKLAIADPEIITGANWPIKERMVVSMKLTLVSKPDIQGDAAGVAGINNQPVTHAFTVCDKTASGDNLNFVESLQMTQEKDGSFTALIPVAIPTSGGAEDPTLNTLATLRLRAESSTSKSGTRRVLVAVTLPYFSLDPEQYSNGVKRISPARSGKSMTAHVVLTLPKEVEQDIKGLYTGDPGTYVARSQIAALLGILRTLVGVTGSEFGSSTPLTVDCQSDDVSGSYSIRGFLSKASSNGVPRAVMASKYILGYAGLTGLEMPRLASETTEDTENIILRAINGLPPIDANAELGVRPGTHNSVAADTLFSASLIG